MGNMDDDSLYDAIPTGQPASTALFSDFNFRTVRVMARTASSVWSRSIVLSSRRGLYVLLKPVHGRIGIGSGVG